MISASGNTRATAASRATAIRAATSSSRSPNGWLLLIEGHRRRGVAEHLLDDLDVGAGGDGQGRGGVPQFVGMQARSSDARRRGGERGGAQPRSTAKASMRTGDVVAERRTTGPEK